jgi:hypothetical protein
VNAVNAKDKPAGVRLVQKRINANIHIPTIAGGSGSGARKMPRSVTTWFCETCGLKHASKEDAEKCESQHYKIGNIIGIQYEAGRRAPVSIQVEVDIGNGDFEKDIFYIVSDEGWGAKKTSKNG